MSTNAKLDGLVGSLAKLERLGDMADAVVQQIDTEIETSVAAVTGAGALAARLAEVNKKLSPFLATQTNAQAGDAVVADVPAPAASGGGDPVLSAADRAAAISAERAARR